MNNVMNNGMMNLTVSLFGNFYDNEPTFRCLTDVVALAKSEQMERLTPRTFALFQILKTDKWRMPD